MNAVLETLRRAAPAPVKSAVKSMILGMGRNPDRPSLVGRGTVQDLYYWVADGRIDTNVLLNNFFSVFFPTTETATHGTMIVHDARGRRIGATDFSIGHLQCVKRTLSRLLRDWYPNGAPAPQFGSLLFTLAIPPAVLAALAQTQGSFYFWHRFYIEYVTKSSQPAFVHCVDKTLIHPHGQSRPMRWYPRPQVRDWAPEMPLNIEAYRRLSVILMNRTSRRARVTLAVQDIDDQCRQFTARIPPNGLHRFELNRTVLRGLKPEALRMRVTGLPTTWARPVLFKEFENGTISTMHC